MESLSVSQLRKSYGEIEALRGVSFTVAKGEIFGIIGADGAGKTTLFRILTTLLLSDSGSATVDGNDCVRDYKKIRRSVGYMPGRFSLYQDLSVEENLHFFASLFGVRVEDNYQLIKDIYVQLEPFKTRRAGKLSGGMKQKLALCCSLIHSPTVLFLDEPTTGVDAVSRREFWQMLHRLKEHGITILVSTPYMDEATLCDRVALIDKGAFLSIDTPATIVRGFGEELYAVSGGNMYTLLNLLKNDPDVRSCYPFGDSIHITLRNKDFLTKYHANNNFEGVKVALTEPNIEDCFLKIVGNGER